MLSKGQKVLMFILGIVGLIIGVIVAIPFRSIPKLNEVENIFKIEIILKVILGVVAIALVVYPLIKKYRLIYNYRENSKIVIVMSYFPMMIYVICSIVNVLHLLCFDYTSVGLHSAIFEKMLGIFIAELLAYMVFVIYAILKTYQPMMKFNQKGNMILDVIIFAFVVSFIILNWRVGTVYSQNYQQFKEYRSGDPVFFFIILFLIVGFGLALHGLIRMFKKDQVLVYYADGEAYAQEVKQKEYSRAYNDTLDDFELYFDDNYDDYQKMSIVHRTETESNDEIIEPVETEEVLEEKDEPIFMEEPTLEEIDTTDSEEVKQLVKEKTQVEENIAKKKEEVIALSQKQSELDEKRMELRNLRAQYDNAFAELQAMKEQLVEEEESEVTTPAKKVKKIVPSFDKMVDYAKSFGNHEGFKVVANPKGNLLKFYIGKKMFLVMQSTNNDYRISFITTANKFVDYLKSRPGELIAPTNLKDNYWVRLTNKGKEEAKFMRKVIKESVQVAEQQIAEEIALKEAEKKARAAQRAKERAAQRAAAKAATANE